MENVISEHFTPPGVFSVIFPIKDKYVLTHGETEIEYCFYNPSNAVTFKYKKNVSNSTEVISSPSDTIIKFVGEDDDSRDIFLSGEGILFVWNENGELICEEYSNEDNRRISYANGSMVIKFKLFNFLYDLKSYTDKESYLPYSFFERESRNIKEIAKGNLKLVDLECGDYYYVDKLGKVNVISLNPLYKFRNNRHFRNFTKFIKKNPKKLEEEAEKLRLNYRSYVPEYASGIFR